RSEIKPTFVPMASVAVTEVLAIVNFALLFPYVIYIFEVMRPETLVSGIMRRARRSLKRRTELMTCVAQVSDIAVGSIQLGDMPVAVLAIDVLAQFLAVDYIPAKKRHSTPSG